jgi:hypothetical protein
MTSDTVDYLMSQKDGANYVVLYQMLCLKTINTEGRFSRTIGEIVIPYDVNKIQRDCKWFSLDTIRVALELYKRFGLVYEEQDGTLVITDHKSLVGSETDYKEQKANQRARKLAEANEKFLLDDGSQASPNRRQDSGQERGHVHQNVQENVHTDIRDKILDIRDIENRGEDIEYIAQKSTDYEQLQKRFDVFWNAYRNKKGKKNAQKAFQRINPDEELFQRIMDGIEKYHNSRKWREGYRKEPATWLNGECWNDEYDDEPVRDNRQSFRSREAAKPLYKPDGTYDYESGESKEWPSLNDLI